MYAHHNAAGLRTFNNRWRHVRLVVVYRSSTLNVIDTYMCNIVFITCPHIIKQAQSNGSEGNRNYTKDQHKISYSQQLIEIQN